MSEDEDVEGLLRAAEEEARRESDPEDREVRLANIARQRERLAEKTRQLSDMPDSDPYGQFESMDYRVSVEVEHKIDGGSQAVETCDECAFVKYGDGSMMFDPTAVCRKHLGDHGHVTLCGGSGDACYCGRGDEGGFAPEDP